MDTPSTKEAKSYMHASSSLWRNSTFLIFWIGQTISAIGDACAVIAFPLLVLQATGSVAQMGFVTASAGIVMLLASVFAGMLVDRVDRRHLLLWCDVLRFLLYSAVPLCWWMLGPHVWLIYVATGVGAGAGLCFQVAATSALVQIVEIEQLTTANSFLQASYSLAYIIGPALAGVIAASLGAMNAIAFDGASFVVSILSLLFLRLRPLKKTSLPEGQTFLSNVFIGFRFLWSIPTLRTVFVFQACVSLMTTGCLDLYIFHIKHDLNQNESAVGLVFGLASLGGVLGGILAPLLRRRLRSGFLWLGSLALGGLMIALIGISSTVITVTAAAIVFTIADTISTIAISSLRQEDTPDYLLGRVNSAFLLIKYATGPLGAAVIVGFAAKTGAMFMLVCVGLLRVLLVCISLLTPARLVGKGK